MTCRLPSVDLDKRWLDRRERWARPDVVFDPRGYAVEVVPERLARDLVLAHHYSGSFPAARLSVGLFRKSGPAAAAELAGVAVFSVPMSSAVIPARVGIPAAEGVELGRFVCLPEVAFNGETWFLRRALAALRVEKREVRAVLSYADPLERWTEGGLLCKPAHYGTIYQAGNASFIGRAKPSFVVMTRGGQVVSGRSLSKIRTQARGHVYASEQLEAAGADPRRPLEDPSDWLRRVLVEPAFVKVRHPGNYCYAFGLDRAVNQNLKPRALAYPKKPTQAPELAEAA